MRGQKTHKKSDKTLLLPSYLMCVIFTVYESTHVIEGFMILKIHDTSNSGFDFW